MNGTTPIFLSQIIIIIINNTISLFYFLLFVFLIVEIESCFFNFQSQPLKVIAYNTMFKKKKRRKRIYHYMNFNLSWMLFKFKIGVVPQPSFFNVKIKPQQLKHFHLHILILVERGYETLGFRIWKSNKERERWRGGGQQWSGGCGWRPAAAWLWVWVCGFGLVGLCVEDKMEVGGSWIKGVEFLHNGGGEALHQGTEKEWGSVLNS